MTITNAQQPPDECVDPSEHVIAHFVVPSQPFTVHEPAHVTVQVPAFVQSIVDVSPVSTVHALLFEQS